MLSGPAPWLHQMVFNSPRLVRQSRASRLASRLRGTSGDQFHDSVLRRDGNHVGDIPPGAIEQPGRDIVFLPDRANFRTLLMAHMPNDFDVLLARLGLSDGDLRVENEIGL